MVRTGLSIALAAGMLAANGSLVTAQQFGTAAEARAMLDRAMLEMKANEAAAVAKFSDKDNKNFRDRDLYVFCFRTHDGIITTHPNPQLGGTDMRNLKVKDDPLGQRLFDEAKEGAVASVNYNFPKPGDDRAGAEGNLCDTHRQSGLWRRLLQINSGHLGVRVAFLAPDALEKPTTTPY